MKENNSETYLQKKDFYNSLITVYGRKPVMEALEDDSINIFRLHLATSNKPGKALQQIINKAEQRKIEIQWHDKRALSRISKNSKQDQGVAADLKLDDYQSIKDFCEQQNKQPCRLIALDNITNPQNLGMIIRSVCASGIDGLILPQKGCAAISPLVIKASAGTLFRAKILYCETLKQGIELLRDSSYEVCTLSSHANQSLFDYQPQGSCIFVLGNESDGVSKEINIMADKELCIPMHNGVESLNVAITAALIAFN